MDGNKNFIHQLDELIALFEKLKEKAAREGVLFKDDPMYKNFELLTGNYKLIKDNIPPELIEEMGEPIKQMIIKMINQLKNELGITEDITNSNNKKADIEFIAPTTEKFDTEKKPDNNSELNKIDKLLKEGNLSEKEINNLLDKRADLMQ
jgi:hypothetical protein